MDPEASLSATSDAKRFECSSESRAPLLLPLRSVMTAASAVALKGCSSLRLGPEVLGNFHGKGKWLSLDVHSCT